MHVVNHQEMKWKEDALLFVSNIYLQCLIENVHLAVELNRNNINQKRLGKNKSKGGPLSMLHSRLEYHLPGQTFRLFINLLSSALELRNDYRKRYRIFFLTFGMRYKIHFKI